MLQLVNVVDHRIDAQKFAAALPPKILSSPKLYPQDCFNLDRRSCVHCLRSRYRCEGQAQILFVLASLLRSSPQEFRNDFRGRLTSPPRRP